MSKTQTKPETPADNPHQPVDTVFQAINESVTSCMSWTAAWNREIADFTARRLSCQHDLVDKVCQCRDGASIAETQREWFEQTQNDYAKQFNKLADLNLSFALNGAEVKPKNSP